MITTDEFIAEARRWVGTPYHDQACRRGIGCDCVGLFRGIGDSFGVEVEAEDDYPPQPSGARMLGYLEANCDRLDSTDAVAARIGTIIAFRLRSDDEGPHHLALRTPIGMLHAWGNRTSGRMGKVVEHGLMWPNQVHSLWWHPAVVR